MKTVNWGVLSVSGHFQKNIFLPLRDSNLVNVLAIASRSIDKAKAAAHEYGIERAYGSYEALLADKDIEAVYIPLPNHLHVEWIKKCVDAGKHVLCEKPLALDAAEAEVALSYAESKGIKVMEAFMYPFHPQWKRVFDLLKVESLGAIHAVHTFFSYNNTDPQNIRNQKDIGGGGLYDIGCYAISVARRVMGKEPQRVLGLISQDEDFGTDILTSGVLDFGGPRATFTVATQSAPFQKVDILGSDGTISVQIPFNMYPDLSAKVIVSTGQGTREISFHPKDQYAELFEAFSQAVIDARPVPTPLSDAVSNMKIIDGIFRSADEGKWIEIS